MKKITIGILAKMAGVGVETIRFYQRKGLLRDPRPVTGGLRSYSEEDSQKIVFIKKTQELGFSLSEVKELLELNTRPRSTCANVKLRTEEKLKQIEKKISDLQRVRSSLQKLSCACDANKDQIKQFKVQECFNLNCDC